MRESFRGYYRPTDDEFKQLWADAEIVLDANVLLNLYRYSIDTRRDLLKLLEQLKSRLWLPHQAAHEYQENRIGVMSKQRSVYSKLRKTLDENKTSILKAFPDSSRHVVLSSDEAEEVVRKAFDAISSHIDDVERRHPDMPEGVAPGEQDTVRDKITEIFDGRVGPAYSAEQLQELYAVGAQRYENEVPPGFEDTEKEEHRAYGDFIMWMQILDHVRDTRQSVILVTDDRKNDWWLLTHGKVVLPHPALVAEFFEVAGNPFYMYRSATFIKRAKRELDSAISDEAVTEVHQFAEWQAHQKLLVDERNSTEARLERSMRKLARLEREETQVVGEGERSVYSKKLAATRAEVEYFRHECESLRTEYAVLSGDLDGRMDDASRHELEARLVIVAERLATCDQAVAQAENSHASLVESSPETQFESRAVELRGLDRRRRRERERLNAYRDRLAEIDHILGNNTR